MVLGTLALLGSPAPRTLAQSATCTQPPANGCPLVLGQPALGLLGGPAQVDTWALQVPSPGDVQVALTGLVADYDLHVFTRDNAFVAESQNEGTQDDILKLQGIDAGDYLVYVNSARGEVSPTPYSLAATFAAPAGPVLASNGAAGWKLLRSDDFSDPSKGLFLDNKKGTNRNTWPDGFFFQWDWEYHYADGGMVARLKGPYPAHGPQVVPTAGMPAADKLSTDFAAEVRASVTVSPEQAQFTVLYALGGPRDAYSFAAKPALRSYSIYWSREPRVLTAGRTSTLAPPPADNVVRLEVRGDTLCSFFNGQQVDCAQHEGITRRGGEIWLQVGMIGPPSDGDVEVRFTDFKIFVPAT